MMHDRPTSWPAPSGVMRTADAASSPAAAGSTSSWEARRLAMLTLRLERCQGDW